MKSSKLNIKTYKTELENELKQYKKYLKAISTLNAEENMLEFSIVRVHLHTLIERLKNAIKSLGFAIEEKAKFGETEFYKNMLTQALREIKTKEAELQKPRESELLEKLLSNVDGKFLK